MQGKKNLEKQKNHTAQNKRERTEAEHEYQFPPKSRPIEQLNIEKADQHSFFGRKKIRLAIKSVTETEKLPAPATKKRRRKKKAAPSTPMIHDAQRQPAAKKSKTYYFKDHAEEGRTDEELEAYHAAVCRFYAGDEYVSPVNAYHDANGYAGVASRTMDDFKSNHDAPLKPADTLIECIKEQHLRSNIIGTAKLMLEDLNQNSKNIGFFETRYDSAAHEKREALKDLITKLTDAPYHQAADLAIKEFDKRNDAITGITSKHDKDLDDHLQKYFEQSKIGWGVYTSIEDLEAADKAVKLEGVDLTAIPEGEYIELIVNSRHTSYLASDLRNYATIKGLAISLTTRYLMQEGDMNNTNFAKDGKMLDFGMTNLPIHKMLNDIEPIDLYMRQKHLDSIAFTARNIRHFPILKDTKPYFWPTQKSFASDILIDAISHYLKHYKELQGSPADALHQQIVSIIKNVLEVVHEYRASTNTTIQHLADTAMGIILQLRGMMASRDAKDIEAEDFTNDLYGMANMLFDKYITNNRKTLRGMEMEMRKELKLDANHFNAADREVMRTLATHPVFEYFKFKTILKYILSDAEMYAAFASLYISPDKDIYSDSHQGTLTEALVSHESDKMYTLYDLTIRMPEFLTFMSEHGESAFKMIMDEETAFKERTWKKHLKHPEGGYYKALAESIKLTTVEERFQVLMGDRLLKLAR